MIEAKEFECGGVKYRCTMFGALKGQRLMVRVLKIIGPAVARGISGLDDNVSFGPALDHFCEGVTEAAFAEIAKDFAEKCEFYSDAKGDWVTLAPHFDDHFAGHYMRLLEWLKGCFGVNYASFFDVLREKGTGIMAEAMKKAERPSPLTSTSQSTG